MASLAAITGGFAIGIFFRSIFVFGWPVIGFILVLAGIWGGAALLKRRRAYSLGAAFFLLVALGMFRASLADVPPPESFIAQLKQHVSYEGIVVGDPSLSDTGQRAPVLVTQSGESTKILAVLPRYPEARVGERITVDGTLTKPEPFATDGGRTFAYDKFLAKDGIRFILNRASLDTIAPAPWYSILAALARVKHAFLNGINAALPEPYASLAGGLVIGGKSGLGTDLLNAFILSGLVQIIVLSGYNVMVVAEGVMALFAALKLSRKRSAIAGAIALVIFVGIAGASATAIRAALMALIALYARATTRSYAASRALLAVIFLMLLYNPLTLVYDPGFDLSVAATAGLIWLAPLIELKLTWIKSAFWRPAIATTFAAQLAVLPMLFYETGRISLYAIPANLLVLAITPLAMACAAIAGISGILFGTLLPMLAIALATPAYALCAYIIWIAQTAAQLPFASLTLPQIPFLAVAFAYAALALIASAKRFSTTVQLRLSKKASM